MAASHLGGGAWGGSVPPPQDGRPTIPAAWARGQPVQPRHRQLGLSVTTRKRSSRRLVVLALVLCVGMVAVAGAGIVVARGMPSPRYPRA
jgi:hypothetical protein